MALRRAAPSSPLFQGPEPRARRLAPIAALLIGLPAGQAALAASQTSSAAQPSNASPSVPASPAMDDRDASTQQGLNEALLLHLAQGTAATFSVDPVIAAPGMDTRITIYLPARIGDGPSAARRFLMFRGLPEGCSLSSGFRTRNNWVVSLGDVGDLTLNIPPQQRESFSVDVLLYIGEENAPMRRTMLVQLSPAVPSLSAGPPDRAAPRGPSSEFGAQSPPRPPAAAPLPKDGELLLAQGATHLRDGNIVFARVLFEELAARGSPQGAFALAQTYDPAVLTQLGVVGILPDLEKAKHWYRKAAELGSIPPMDIISSLKKERPQQ